MSAAFVRDVLAMPRDTSTLDLDAAVIPVSELMRAEHLLRGEHRTRLRAANILRAARRRARAIQADAETAAARAVHEACLEQAEGMHALAAALGGMVADLVHTVLTHYLIDDVHERVRLCAALAAQTLQHDLTAVVLARPEDEDFVRLEPSLRARMKRPKAEVAEGAEGAEGGYSAARVAHQASDAQTKGPSAPNPNAHRPKDSQPAGDHEVRQGTLELRTAHGTVTIDPSLLIETICSDLRRSLVSARDMSSAAPGHATDALNQADSASVMKTASSDSPTILLETSHASQPD